MHQDFKTYYTQLLALLEQLFGVDFAAPPEPAALWMLFMATVDSYLSIRTPWSSFLEEGLIIRKVEALGPQGGNMFRLSQQIQDLSEANREAHLQLLYALFERIYGKHDLVVTSQDLQAKGFDDTKEPKIIDYWEHA